MLRQAFDPRALEDEVDQSLRDAFSHAVAVKLGGGAISFRYVPMMCERTPVSLSLLDRLAQPAAKLLGGPVLPVRAKGVRYAGATSWHSDDSGYGVQSVGFAAYLDPLGGESGALRVLPGSHRSELGGALAGYVAGCQTGLTEQTREAWILSLPSVPIHTEPGDIIAFDERLYHASVGGRNRRQWRVDFVLDARAPEEEERLRAYYRGTYLPDWDGGYDVDRYPSYGSHWLASGRPWIERLGELGVYEAAAAEEAFARSRRT